MQLNPAARELIFKVVYYGPGMAGKTSNLRWLRDQAPEGTASDLVTVDTHSERTLHFDLLAVDLGEIQGHRVRIEFHTVPGQSYYAATRRQVLTGADAVVFVADSRREALDENIASMNEMLDNLRQLGMPSQIPLVLQYNKQDLPTAVKPEQLDPLMNVRSWPSRAASAVNGHGVNECARDILSMLAEAAAQVSLPEVPDAIAPRTWLISCHRCQAMLEVPDAAPGSIYTCGVCASTLEVVDPDRGLTREPIPGRTPAPAPPQPMRVEEPSDYAMKTLPVQQAVETGESALQPAQTGVAAAAGGSFPLAGWEVVAFLDESPQGRRLRVREVSSGRMCRALVLSPQLMAQPGYADAIEPYVRLAGPLKHPHLLPLLEMRPAGDTVVLLSADVPEHEPLHVVLGRRRALAPPHAMGLLRQVVLALEDAARQGVIHGWLRPECILVSPDGSVLVDEFAVPKSHRLLVRDLAGASAATEYYLAPEHLGEDARSDLRSDMFLCGALLYRMITGEGLVTGYNAHEALHRLMASGGKPLRSVGNTVSRDLDLFYKRLTALNRSERFDGYRQLVEVLDRFGGGAKRQTMRLTQPVNAPGGPPGSAAVVRSGGQRPSGHALRNPTGPVGSGQRRVGTGEIARAHVPKKGGGAAVVVVVVVLLAMAGVVAYVMMQQRPPAAPAAPAVQAQRPPVAPAPAPAPTRAETPARPATPGSIGGAVPERPVVAQPEPDAKPTPPAVQPAVRAEMTPADRRDLLNRIADLSLEERFQQALTLAEQLPTAEDRQAQYQQVIARREERRRQLDQLARGAPALADVQRAAKPALDGVWGMPGDREWARGLLDQAEARLAAAQPEVPPAPEVVAPPPVVQVAVPTPEPTPAPEPPPAALAAPAADPGLQTLSALAKGEFPLAQSNAETVPEGLPEGQALRLAVQAYPRRHELLDRVAKAHSAKLRLIHPTTRESVDVVGASPNGLEVTAPGGATSALTWTQVGSRDVGRLLGEAANAAGATPADHACAVSGLVVGAEVTLAAVHLRKARPTLTAEQAAVLDGLLALGRRAEAQVWLSRAIEAQKAGSVKVLGECLVELRKPERASVPTVAAVLPRLEAALREAQEGKTSLGVKLVDRVTFDGPEDLQQFPEAAGTWQVATGQAVNSDVARLVRRDAASARSVQVIFTPTAMRGQIGIDFKGMRLVLDLATGQFTTQLANQAGTPPPAAKPCSVVERVPNTLFLSYADTGNHTTVELNGQVIADLVMGDLNEYFAFSTAAGAIVQIDEVSFTRNDSALPGKQGLRRLGWEPTGAASLDEKASAIILAGTAQAPASILNQVPANTVGYTIEVKGQGAFRIQVGGQGGWQRVDLTLTAGEAARFTVRWANGTFAVLDGQGVPVQSVALERPVTTVVFQAAGQTAIALPIRPNRQ
jgi:signal recognition particle receptor subunit beta/serine/threonine protein kinase